MARKSRRGKNMRQSLVYSSATTSSAGTATLVLAGSNGLNVPATRPSRPVYVEFEFFSAQPRSFSIRLYGSAGEEIFNSPVILSGPIPRKRRFVLPSSTDFGIYTGSETVIQFQHATNPSINYVVNICMEHKYIPPLTNF
jgi:hypothetical protein